MQMQMGLRLSLGQRTVLRLRLPAETTGEIPLYSLHRIRRLLGQLPVTDEFRAILQRHLIAQNAAYKEESGRDWSCLGARHLIDAINGVDEELNQTIRASLAACPQELVTPDLPGQLHEGRLRGVEVIKRWFDERFDDLFYDTSGKVPWAVVRRLRKDLGNWITTAVDPFTSPIGDMVLEVAREQGLGDLDDAEIAWERMGGKLFKSDDD